MAVSPGVSSHQVWTHITQKGHLIPVNLCEDLKHRNYLNNSLYLLGHFLKETEPLRNTWVSTHLNLYVLLFGVDVCWRRWDIHWPLVTLSPSDLARILPWMCAT